MKKATYPNQGQPIQDIYVTGISRIFLDGNNVICVVESRCGIESETEIYLNETARLILPTQDLTSVKNSLKQALSYLEKEIQPTTPIEKHTEKDHPDIKDLDTDREGEIIAIFNSPE